MRKKGNKIIKPAGSELMDYLNRGYAICNKCGAVMDRRKDSKADVTFTPARPADGKLMRWTMSTRMETRWNLYSTKEVASA